MLNDGNDLQKARILMAPVTLYQSAISEASLRASKPKGLLKQAADQQSCRAAELVCFAQQAVYSSQKKSFIGLEASYCSALPTGHAETNSVFKS